MLKALQRYNRTGPFTSIVARIAGDAINFRAIICSVQFLPILYMDFRLRILGKKA